jgi:hypothetical protein
MSPAKFDVDLLKPVSYDSGWEDLVLPKGHREMVQALVDAHPKGNSQLFEIGRKRVDSDLLSKKGKSKRLEPPSPESSNIPRQRMCGPPPRSTRNWKDIDST